MPKAEYSCNVTTKLVTKYENMQEHDHFFNKLELFEAIEDEGKFIFFIMFHLTNYSDQFVSDSSTIFCGGPVTAMTWLPTPHILLHCSQILAVAVGKDFETKYMVNMNYTEKSIIQFWDFGILKKKVIIRYFLYCFILEYI